ncbi:MAG: bifunctional 3-(3-hydroxy-phenyl)propionate/3-hydroxycinnamic acid hydroxylase [Undibacterium sp.]|uniref:bifunctional 3-(3-hydroxy-phenyl)propionate/3-hydroxycinnamic acid hydroxylase MhpA n=1 Tax=Undibacterium sp. TaxID=1914977 RepID=UPI002719B91F|nr:bifunctional 3-(3-hydroxy-phenyl)propionate/3-hydroxycinnamic acid hydroxylase [Undibacterium sp.]MDO8650924.1 bifunctional 3-(3-hydroxy-phenyl)propionate/3-hydroxycinnamic acid hydroxylase [Undibacterium sp.]
MNTTPDTDLYDVIISGLGPTGLTMAHMMGKRGLKVMVLEREPEFYGNARAVYTDDECMRIFQSVDLADELAADMLQDAPVQLVLPDNSVLLQMKDTKRPYGWASNNFFYQPYLETTMADTLARYPTVSIQRGREVVRFEQNEDFVNVYYIETQGAQYGKQAAPVADKESLNKVEHFARAKYLIGCDGGRSIVRTQLGIEMTGKSFPNPWLVVDIREKEAGNGLRHLPYFDFICDPDCPTVSCTQPDGHHRFEFMLMPGQTREYMEDPATIKQFLSKYVDISKFDILRTLVYTFNALIAEKWRDRRVFLAGDAAHMTPQFIGQGMNAGIRDAYNLAWKLDAVLKGVSSDELLNSYQTERRPHVNDMIKIAVLMKDYVSMANPVLAFMRNLITRIVKVTPMIGTFVKEGAIIPLPVYKQGQYFGLPRRSRKSAEGRLMPQPGVRAKDGHRYLIDQLSGDGFTLIGAGVNPCASLSADERRFWDALNTRYLTVFPYGERPQHATDRKMSKELIEVEDIDGAYFDWLRKSGNQFGDVAVVRPDKFVYAMAPAKKMTSITRHMAEQLGLSITSKKAHHDSNEPQSALA